MSSGLPPGNILPPAELLELHDWFERDEKDRGGGARVGTAA